jgi:uncharacterized iron-regulated membrane protein
MTSPHRRQVRFMIATVRRAFPDFPLRQRQPGETADVAEVEELGDLIKQMMAQSPPSAQEAVRLRAAASASTLRNRLETELRAGSRTAARLLTGLFADSRDGSH